MGRRNLEQRSVANVTLEIGNGAAGWDRDAPYDIIAVTASSTTLEDSLARQLTVGGRMFIVVGAEPAMEALLVERVGESEWTRDSLFETVLAPLRGVETPDPFQF